MGDAAQSAGLQPAHPGPPVGQYLGRRLFYRLAVVALPSLIAVILVGAVGLWAFDTLGRQGGAVQAALQASTTANSLAGKLDNLVTNLDQLTIPGNQYNALIYTAGRNGVVSDTQALQALDLSFAPETRTIQAQLVHDLQGNIADLDQLNSANSSNLNARYQIWTAGLRDRVLHSDTMGHTLATGWAAAAQGKVQTADVLFVWGRAGIFALILLAVGASMLSTTLFTRNIMRPIGRLRENMERLANGDLTVHTAPQAPRQASRDELEALEEVYQRMLLTLRPLILHIQDDARQISSSAAEISATAAQQDRDSNEQATATTQVTVTVEELNQTAVQIADAAASVAAAAEQALVSASRGQEAVRDS
ncbi:MAG TPA: methyl-accepting chemotaxis protein, partial [Chloroflexia bacterium]|nr:methyl-accepting chemotaxis protein [Chloroflexia bacterium]